MHMLTLSCVDEETNFNKLVCAMSKIVRTSVLKLAERRFRAGQTCRLMHALFPSHRKDCSIASFHSSCVCILAL